MLKHERCLCLSWRAVNGKRAGEICSSPAAVFAVLQRCEFHEGYLDTLAAGPAYDGATCFLVSQFLLEPAARAGFFRQIAQRLKPAGLLANADLAADIQAPAYEVLLHGWMTQMSSVGVDADRLARARLAYARDGPAQQVAEIIQAAGFKPPVPFFQAGLMHGWLCLREAAV